MMLESTLSPAAGNVAVSAYYEPYSYRQQYQVFFADLWPSRAIAPRRLRSSGVEGRRRALSVAVFYASMPIIITGTSISDTPRFSKSQTNCSK